MSRLFGRRAGLFVTRPANDDDPLNFVSESTLDLSQMQFQFKTTQQDDEGPDNCSVRVYNLSDKTRNQIIKFGFSEITLQAGYEGQYGVIFQGTVKQFRVGRENATDKYLDILAADGDIAYNFGLVNSSVARGQRRDAILNAIVKDWSTYGTSLGQDLSPTGGTLLRGKVLWGLGRVQMRQYADTAGCTWNLSGNQVNVIPLKGYLQNEIVKLNTQTGLIGLPEQTQDGIKCRVLLNPKIQVGGRVQLDNALINQLIGADGNRFAGTGSIPFNAWSAPTFLADATSDGIYRVFVAEHSGDLRGQEFYTDLTLLAIDATTNESAP